MVSKTIYYITHWETWHWFAKYIFIGPVWLWHCLRSGSFWFFTPSNPTITFGGFIGETKREIYGQLPPSTYPKSIYISPSTEFSDVENLVEANGFSFPIAVKPDIGMMGFMFRKIETVHQLRQYHKVMQVDYVLQDLVTYPLEVSVFYHRLPNQKKGNITGFIKKEFMEVTGDGQRTLKELILNYPRARFRIKELYSKHEKKLHYIIPAGEQFCLSYALNLSRGGRLVSLAHEKDERLLNVFDDLSHYAKTFYYGRYDIKCLSIEDLKRGKNFSIVEYNGCGAEPHHIYGDGNTFLQSCMILLHHWNVLSRISRYNHQQGIPYWKHSEGSAFTKDARKHFKKLKELDAVFEFEDETAPPTNKIVPHSLPESYRVSQGSEAIIEDYLTHVGSKEFPCIAAKAAQAKEQIRCMVAEHLACPKDDGVIVQFLYEFVDEYRRSENLYNSAVVLFKGPEECDEEMFDKFLWQRLQAIADLDAVHYQYDSRVNGDPSSSNFSFSLKEEAVYVIGLHPLSSRKARQFRYPALVFNPHGQFEKLRATSKYDRMRRVVRSRDVNFSGSVNPMLADFGESSEVFQYSGRHYDKDWKCPFISHHASIKNNSSS